MAEFIRFTERLVSSEFRYAFALSAADLTGSGSLDLVATHADRGLYWFENDGAGNFTRHVVHLRTNELLERHAVADVNGLIDLVGTASKRGDVAWYRNPGNSLDSPWTKHVIDTAPRPIHGHPVDMDGDGDIDLVLALGFDLPKGADRCASLEVSNAA